MEGVLVIKNVPHKLISPFNGGSIGDQERVCQTHQFPQWREYWWWRTCLSNYSASSMVGVLVIKNVPVKPFSFFNGGIICDQERVCQILQFVQWREYWWSRTCLSNYSASSMEGVLVIKDVSAKLFSFFNAGMIGDQERVCQIVHLLQWREYWLSRTCLPNSSADLMEGVLVIKNVFVKLFSFFNGGSIGDQELTWQTLQLHKRREYWWSKTCLSNSSAYLLEGVLVIKNVSVKISASLMEGVLVIKNVFVKLFSFFNGGSIGDQELTWQTLQLHKRREYW